jgi:hypothetical protein
MLTSMVAIHNAVLAAHTYLAEGTEGKEHPGINAPLNGGIVLAALLVLLFITTRLNKDR